MDSLEESIEKKWSKFFQAVISVNFGSLFRVSEEIWKRADRYDQKSTRKDHPGCSLTRLNNTLGVIHMLHGTSDKDTRKKSEDIILIEDIYGRPHKTWFGGLDPILIEFDLLQQKRDSRADKPRANTAEFRHRKVSFAEKSIASPSEIQKLKELCDKKGW